MCCCAEVQQYVSTTINLYVSKSARLCVSTSVQQQHYTTIALYIKVLPFLIYSSYSISILITSNFWLMPAGRHASRPACGQAGRQASVYATIRINKKIYPINMPKGDSSSVSILLLGSLNIGKRYSESGITAIFPIRRTRILVSTKTQQGVLWVTQRLFGYFRKEEAARYVLSNSKPFKPCRRASSPKSGSLMFHLSTIYIQTYYFPNDLNILVMQRFFCSMFGWT